MNHIHAKLDKIGMTASTVCAIHCAAVPVLVSVFPLLGLGFLSTPWIEWGMIAVSFVIGFYSIGKAYFFMHRKLLPMLLLIGGFTTILAGHLVIYRWSEAVVVPVGGFLIAYAHFINYKTIGFCKTKHC